MHACLGLRNHGHAAVVRIPKVCSALVAAFAEATSTMHATSPVDELGHHATALYHTICMCQNLDELSDESVESESWFEMTTRYLGGAFDEWLAQNVEGLWR